MESREVGKKRIPRSLFARPRVVGCEQVIEYLSFESFRIQLDCRCCDVKVVYVRVNLLSRSYRTIETAVHSVGSLNTYFALVRLLLLGPSDSQPSNCFDVCRLTEGRTVLKLLLAPQGIGVRWGRSDLC